MAFNLNFIDFRRISKCHLGAVTLLCTSNVRLCNHRRDCARGLQGTFIRKFGTPTETERDENPLFVADSTLSRRRATKSFKRRRKCVIRRTKNDRFGRELRSERIFFTAKRVGTAPLSDRNLPRVSTVAHRRGLFFFTIVVDHQGQRRVICATCSSRTNVPSGGELASPCSAICGFDPICVDILRLHIPAEPQLGDLVLLSGVRHSVSVVTFYSCGGSAGGDEDSLVWPC